MFHTYLDQASTDLDHLGYPPPDKELGNPESWGHEALHLVLDRTWIDIENIPRTDATASQLQTSVGKQALAMLRGPHYEIDGLDIVCDTAESKLLANISDASVNNEDLRSPIIVTNNKLPVAIIKGLGEVTSYGLINRAPYGIWCGVFASPQKRGYLFVDGRPPRAPHAWKLDVNALGGLQSRRVSTFVVPKKARPFHDENLTAEANSMLHTSHTAIVRQACRLLRKAKPLPEL